MSSLPGMSGSIQGQNSNYHYIEKGNHLFFTQVIDDETVFVGQNLTITGIKAYFNDINVSGLEIYYNGGMTTGPHIGTDTFITPVSEHIKLNDGEVITSIYGTYISEIHHLKFTTNHGRFFQFGNNTFGTPFQMQFPNLAVKTIKYGIGKHLHFIGVKFGPVMTQFPSMPYMQTPLMMSSPQMITGQTPQQMIPINAGSQGQISMQASPMGVNFLTEPGKSNMGGNILLDTVHFDDSINIKALVMSGMRPHIKRIKVFHDSKTVYGIEVDYDVYKDHSYSHHHKTFKEIHKGSATPHFCKTHEVTLKHGEHVTAITGKFTNIIHHLCIFTTNGIMIDAGGAYGNDFSLNIPQGRMVYALGGGVGGHLHYLCAHYI